jgi:hypothetical protein
MQKTHRKARSNPRILIDWSWFYLFGDYAMAIHNV